MNLEGNQTKRFNYGPKASGVIQTDRYFQQMVNNGILDKAIQSPHVRVGVLSAEFSYAGSGLAGISPPQTFPSHGDLRHFYLQKTSVYLSKLGNEWMEFIGFHPRQGRLSIPSSISPNSSGGRSCGLGVGSG